MAEPEDRLTLGPLAAGQFERHSMRESFHVVLAFDDRMPVRYGGHGGTRPGSPEPKIPHLVTKTGGASRAAALDPRNAEARITRKKMGTESPD